MSESSFLLGTTQNIQVMSLKKIQTTWIILQNTKEPMLCFLLLLTVNLIYIIACTPRNLVLPNVSRFFFSLSPRSEMSTGRKREARSWITERSSRSMLKPMLHLFLGRSSSKQRSYRKRRRRRALQESQSIFELGEVLQALETQVHETFVFFPSVKLCPSDLQTQQKRRSRRRWSEPSRYLWLPIISSQLLNHWPRNSNWLFQPW